MAKGTQQKLLELYATLMDEAKVRINAVDRAVNGRIHMPGPIVREFCYLQLRLLCELIALSCLVAHGDFSVSYSKRLRRQWSAEKIMDDLTRLNPDLYPHAARQTPLTVPGKPGYNFDVINPSPLPKGELLKLYGQCHHRLHRGNVSKLLTSDTPIDTNPNFPEIISWAQRINDLLQCHLIALRPEKGLACVLRDQNGRVSVGIFEPPEKVLLS
jgi:hypothetical protein